MFVIDTNVLYSAVIVKDPTHHSAINFLNSNDQELHAPELLKIELSSLLSRKLDPIIAEGFYNHLISRILFHENPPVEVLVEYVKHKKVRGCDAFFAYLADTLNCKVVSFDKDLISKCHGKLLIP